MNGHRSPGATGSLPLAVLFFCSVRSSRAARRLLRGRIAHSKARVAGLSTFRAAFAGVCGPPLSGPCAASGPPIRDGAAGGDGWVRTPPAAGPSSPARGPGLASAPERKASGGDGEEDEHSSVWFAPQARRTAGGTSGVRTEPPPAAERWRRCSPRTALCGARAARWLTVPVDALRLAAPPAAVRAKSRGRAPRGGATGAGASRRLRAAARSRRSPARSRCATRRALRPVIRATARRGRGRPTPTPARRSRTRRSSARSEPRQPRSCSTSRRSRRSRAAGVLRRPLAVRRPAVAPLARPPPPRAAPARLAPADALPVAVDELGPEAPAAVPDMRTPAAGIRSAASPPPPVAPPPRAAPPAPDPPPPGVAGRGTWTAAGDGADGTLATGTRTGTLGTDAGTVGPDTGGTGTDTGGFGSDTGGVGTATVGVGTAGGVGTETGGGVGTDRVGVGTETVGGIGMPAAGATPGAHAPPAAHVAASASAAARRGVRLDDTGRRPRYIHPRGTGVRRRICRRQHESHLVRVVARPCPDAVAR